MKNKLLSILTLTVIVSSLVACGNKTVSETTDNNVIEDTTNNEVVEETVVEDTTDDIIIEEKEETTEVVDITQDTTTQENRLYTVDEVIDMMSDYYSYEIERLQTSIDNLQGLTIYTNDDKDTCCFFRGDNLQYITFESCFLYEDETLFFDGYNGTGSNESLNGSLNGKQGIVMSCSSSDGSSEAKRNKPYSESLDNSVSLIGNYGEEGSYIEITIVDETGDTFSWTLSNIVTDQEEFDMIYATLFYKSIIL